MWNFQDTFEKRKKNVNNNLLVLFNFYDCTFQSTILASS